MEKQTDKDVPAKHCWQLINSKFNDSIGKRLKTGNSQIEIFLFLI